jgi:KDO2-lipid IV(A) lauroyltransferase
LPPPPAARLSVQSRIAAFWTNLLFTMARRAPWLVRWIAPLVAYVAWRTCTNLRLNTLANARHLLGPDASRAELARLSRRVIRSCYLFVVNMGTAGTRTLDQMHDCISSVEGQEHYDSARADGRGLIVATAHFGSYEVGMAGLRQREEHVHIVFQRDPLERFEQLRHALHERLGIHEVPIGVGMQTWLTLRDALQRDEVVVMQADRVMPSQRGQEVPFFDGHLEFPLGAVKMSRLTGSPILPIFAIDDGGGKVRMLIEPPIRIDTDRDDGDDPLNRLASAIEKVVRAHPEQWMLLEKAWVEDRQVPNQ